MIRKIQTVLLIVTGLVARNAPASGTDVSEAPEPPVYLQGVDLDQPAPEAFADWPPDALLERPYWLPWGAAAFQRAALFGRPIFFLLTVNWSGESNEWLREQMASGAVLRTLNRGYIAIRVNADMRPDLRERYQTGAWPTVAFLLPNGRPMLSQANDLGVAKPITTSAVDAEALEFLLSEGLVYWDRWRDLLLEVGDYWTEREGPDDPVPGAADGPASDVMARWLAGNADRAGGGFGLAPKFIVPALQEYAALRAARAADDLGDHAGATLQKLVSGPLWDSEEGGLRRLAAAPDYGAIQHEKKLEVNAALIRQLVWALRERATRELERALAAATRFVLEGLGRPGGGGFYLAQFPGADGTPQVDRLVLSGPNVLAGAAILRAGLWLDDAAMREAGRGAIDMVLREAFRAGRGVGHVIEPVADARVYLEAQAEAAFGLVDAYETTGEVRYLDAAQQTIDSAWLNLKDPGNAVLRDHLADRYPLGLLVNPRYPMRPNVLLARAMLRVGLHGRGEVYIDRAAAVVGGYSGDLSSYGVHGTAPALAIEELISEPLRIRISGDPDDPATQALRRAAVNAAWPWTLVETVEGDGEPSAEVTRGSRSRAVGDPEDLAAAVPALTTGER